MHRSPNTILIQTLIFARYAKLKKQRLNVRDEREEIFNAAVIAFVKHCEISIYEECLFEVKAPLKQIAMELGLISKNGRYDRLNRLIDMMEEAGMVVVMHEFDKERYKQKAVRIFLLPDFFYSLGHTPESLKKNGCCNKSASYQEREQKLISRTRQSTRGKIKRLKRGRYARQP